MTITKQSSSVKCRRWRSVSWFGIRSSIEKTPEKSCLPQQPSRQRQGKAKSPRLPKVYRASPFQSFEGLDPAVSRSSSVVGGLFYTTTNSSRPTKASISRDRYQMTGNYRGHVITLLMAAVRCSAVPPPPTSALSLLSNAHTPVDFHPSILPTSRPRLFRLPSQYLLPWHFSG